MQNSKGFTLIEVMIVVVIIGILAAMSYPSYTEYVLRGKRADGKALLLDAAARQERYFAQNNKYANDVASLGGRLTDDNKHYNLSADGNATGFTITATPTFTDTRCGKLTFDHLGSRTAAGDVDYCWK